MSRGREHSSIKSSLLLIPCILSLTGIGISCRLLFSLDSVLPAVLLFLASVACLMACLFGYLNISVAKTALLREEEQGWRVIAGTSEGREGLHRRKYLARRGKKAEAPNSQAPLPWAHNIKR